MAEFKMNLGGVTPLGVTEYIEPGEYTAKISGFTQEDTKYGHGFRFEFQVIDESSEAGKRIDDLLFVPDDLMERMATKVQKEEGRKQDYVKNFMGFMQRKWVSLILAAGLGEQETADARKIAKSVKGKTVEIIVGDRKKQKPTDNTYSEVKGVRAVTESFDLSGDDESDDDSFDLNALDDD